MITRFSGAGFTIDEDAPDLKQAFQFLAECNELFGAAADCEYCQSKDIVPRHRKHDNYDFYELLCKNCKATFRFGQTKDDKKLFPKGWEAPYGGGETQAPAKATGKKPQVQEAIPF